MELRHIRYFVRAAEMLHFTKAAESLFISQPTLSTHIQQLEEELEARLFERVGRTVKLTPAGQVFLERGQQALSTLDCAKQKITRLKELSDGTVRLGVLLTFGPTLLPGWLASFNALYPNIRVSVKTGSSDFIEQEVRSGNSDLGITFVPPESDSLDSEILLQEPIVVAVSKEHPLAAQKEIRLEQMINLPLALVSKQWTARRLYDAYFMEHGIEPNVQIEIDAPEALLTLAARGNVCTMMSRLAASTAPNLHLLPIAEKPPLVNYGLIWHAQAGLSPSGQAFREHLRRESSLVQSAKR